MIRDLARKSRSWRGYDESRKVSREELVEMVECARLCPSSVNMQPLKYYLAWEEEQVKFFADQSCGESEISAHQRRFAGAVAPQYLNISNGGQQ